MGLETFPPGITEAWAKFLQGEAGRSPGKELYFDVFEDPILFPLQRSRELAAMMRRARVIKPQIVMEIGSDKGGSFYHWIKSLPTVTKAIAIEIRGIPFEPDLSLAFPQVNLLCLGASSRDTEAVRQVDEFLGTDRIDCLFLDGEKAMVERDFAVWWPRMRRGGLVFIHDITDDIAPRRLFRALEGRMQTETIYDPSEVEDLPELTLRAPAYAAWLNHWKATSCGVGVVLV